MIPISSKDSIKLIEILIVDDSESDLKIVEETFNRGKLRVNLHTVKDGIYAMEYLEMSKSGDKICPDLILLDLNMPRKDGREFLEEIKSSEDFKKIPVIVVTISKDQEDILKSYSLHANAYVVKPIELNQFIATVRSIEDFWFTIVKLPTQI
jgi:two-component system, chemotaxis family, response regulator Rcp1